MHTTSPSPFPADHSMRSPQRDPHASPSYKTSHNNEDASFDTYNSTASPSVSSNSARSCTSSPLIIDGEASTASVRAILSSVSVSGESSPQKKRRREEEYAQLKLLQHPKAGSSRAGAPLTATHEIRFLRKEVADMEQHLLQLESKWVEAIPDERVLASACQAAKEKWTTSLVEKANGELRDQLTQQQFIFASLQSSILQSPLQAQCREMFDGIHMKTRLTTDPDERIKQLHAHCEAGLSCTPEIIRQFTNHIASNPTPYSQTNITGGAANTFISNVFVMELPHTSLAEVFQATLGYYAQLPKEMPRCLATKMEVTPLNLLGKLRQYAKVKFMNELFSTTINTIFAAEIIDGIACIYSDAIVADPLHPTPEDEAITRIGVTALTITPVTDVATGKICKIVVRRVLVYRYNLLPHDPLVQKDMKIKQCLLNGDLMTAMICQNLQHQRPDIIEQAGAGTYCM